MKKKEFNPKNREDYFIKQKKLEYGEIPTRLKYPIINTHHDNETQTTIFIQDDDSKTQKMISLIKQMISK